jgi:hypothetical protein
VGFSPRSAYPANLYLFLSVLILSRSANSDLIMFGIVDLFQRRPAPQSMIVRTATTACDKHNHVGWESRLRVGLIRLGLERPLSPSCPKPTEEEYLLSQLDATAAWSQSGTLAGLHSQRHPLSLTN